MGWQRNVLMGMAAGAAGTMAMNGYWKGMARLGYGGSSKDEPTTNKAARQALRRAGIKSPPRQVVATGGQAVHWGYGAGWGAVVGIARSAGMRLDWGAGQPLGAGLWAFGDLWLVYRMGLSPHPREFPTSVHAAALGAHLAYGLGLWSTMKGMEALQHQEQRARRRRAA